MLVVGGFRPAFLALVPKQQIEDPHESQTCRVCTAKQQPAATQIGAHLHVYRILVMANLWLH